MSIRRRARRLPSVIAAVALAVGGLAAVHASTQPAAAQQNACSPAGPTPPAQEWETKFTDRGVTLCRGFDTVLGVEDDMAFVQIVDLHAGAKVRLASEPCRTCDGYSDTLHWTDLPFHKRTAADWFDWIVDNNVLPPEFGSDLFSTSNASFFPDTSFTSPTSPLFLPEKTLFDVFPKGGGTTFGKVFNDEGPDWIWDSPKVALSLGDVTAPGQSVEMFEFPMHYLEPDVDRLFYGGVLGEPGDPNRLAGDQTVGRAPNVGEPTAPRTYVGVNSSLAGGVNKVFILNTSEAYSLADAERTLESFGSVVEVQLDGGASTQMYALGEYQVADSIPIFDRAVPDTLAVYLAP